MLHINFKLRTRLLLSYLFVILLPVVFVGYFLVSRTTETVLDRTDYINKANFQQISQNIYNQLNTYLDLSDTMMLEKQLNDYLNTEYSTHTAFFDMYNEYLKIKSTYSGILKVRVSENAKVVVYTSNDYIIPDNDFICKVDNKFINKTQWCQDAIRANGENVISGSYLNDKGKMVFMISRLLYGTTKYTNILTIEVRESEVYKLIERETANKKIFLINNNNNKVISSSERHLIGESADEISYLQGIKLDESNGFNEIKKDNRSNVIFMDTFKGRKVLKNWKVISVISSESMLNDINGIVRYSLFICSISVLVAVIFVVLFSNTLTKKIRLLVRNMRKVRDGEFNVVVDDKGYDEISELSKSFNSMTDRINYLVNEVHQSELQVRDLEIEKKEAEICALQSQINPHFLFNTMESIRMDLWLKQEFEISEVIERFSMLLRKSIEWSGYGNTIMQEKQLIEDYLQIQKYRYVDKLDYKIDISPDLNDFCIPKFSLQPIVENAIGHGIELKKGKGCVLITSQICGDDIKLIVKDDGIGIPEDKLVFIRELLDKPQNKGGKERIGIRNVHQRLRLQFGDKYGLNIKSCQGKGTQVELLIPKIITKRGNENV